VNPALEMRLWLQSANPDYQEAVKERLAELRGGKRRKAERAELKAIEAAGKEEEAKKFRAKLRARNKLRVKKKNNVKDFAVRLGHCEDREQFKRDLFNRLLSIIPRRGVGFVLRSESLKEEGHLSDLEVWNGYEWERG